MSKPIKVTLRMDTKLHALVEKEARSIDSTVSHIIRMAVRSWILTAERKRQHPEERA
jgi:hypothetical protein